MGVSFGCASSSGGAIAVILTVCIAFCVYYFVSHRKSRINYTLEIGH